MSKNLFAADSDSNEDELELKLNKEYAKSYNKFRQQELYKKLKDQDKNATDSDSTDSDSTDENDELINPKFDQDFFKTLSSLKSKDPKIYDQNTNFFENIINDDDNNNDTTKLRKSMKSKKPLTLKDYERKVILEKNGKFEDDSDSDDYINNKHQRSESPTYAEAERQLKEEFKNVLKNNEEDASASEVEEFGGIFKKRQKTTEDKTKEDEEYMKWLAGEKEDIEESTKKTLNPLKQYWNNPKLPKQEKFLRDYILNKGYVDKECHEIPTYDEIVGNDINNLSEDENELEKQAEFEHKFNFRFEEPDQEFIKRYPRTIDNSVRKTNDNRRQKRLEIKERKLHEKDEKMKQLEILKEMKRQEIEEKIKKLKEVTGNDELPFQTNEFDDDFDPDAHDRKMQEIFNDDYYGIEEDGEEKPECPDIDELKYEDWDNYDPERDDEDDAIDKIPNCEDDDFIMDCDYNPNAKEIHQNELIESTKDRRKGRKKRNQFKEMIKKDKPVFNPEDEKTYEEYINEYYKMDCEDMIGDLPCRFKYTETVPNDFGLTIEEILLAKNRELNQWASLKKATQIRSEHVEKNERRLYQMKAQNIALKKKIFISLYGASDDEVEDETINNTSSKEDNNTINNKLPSQKNKTKPKKRKASEISGDIKIVEKKLKVDNKRSSNIAENDKTCDENNTIETENIKLTNKKKKKPKHTNISNENIKTVKTIKKLEKNNKLDMSLKEPVISNPFKKGVNNTTTENKKNEKDYKFKQNTNQFKKTIQPNKHFKQDNKNNLNKVKSKNINKKNEKSLSDERLKAYGINPKKYNKKQNYLNRKNKVNTKKEENLNDKKVKNVNKKQKDNVKHKK